MRASLGGELVDRLRQPLGGRQPELSGVPADGVGELGAAANQLVTHPNQHQRGLLLSTLHRHEPLLNPRPAHRFADRLGIGCVVLVALHILFRILRRHQHHLVPQSADLARPIMRSAAGFDADPRRWQLGKKLNDLPPPQLLAQRRLLGAIHAMQLKNTLGRVHTNADKIVHGRLPC